jgi:hypothetical protein
MRTDPALEASFRTLIEQNIQGNPPNETLFLVKYAFFPHTLSPGPGHKSNITKASRYAKLINHALDQNIDPAEFVAFARSQGIQRTAAGSRSRIRRVPLHRRRPASRASTVATGNSLLATILKPLEAWFASNELAARLAACLRAAQARPQKISLTVYVNDQRAVWTSMIGQACQGEFPVGTISAGKRRTKPAAGGDACSGPAAKATALLGGSTAMVTPRLVASDILVGSSAAAGRRRRRLVNLAKLLGLKSHAGADDCAALDPPQVACTPCRISFSHTSKKPAALTLGIYFQLQPQKAFDKVIMAGMLSSATTMLN